MMHIEQFRARAQHCEADDEIDQLCWDWLAAAAQDNGHPGQVALELMRMIRARLMP